MCPGIIDTHAHYDDVRFDDGRDELLSGITAQSEINPLGISGIINCGSDIASSEAGAALCERYPFFRFAAGVHPHEADSFGEAAYKRIIELSKHRSCVAIGEIGLDYYYDFSPRDVQKKVFSAQLELAGELGMPVVIHDRDAHGDTMELISSHRKTVGIMHSFSGSGEMAKELVKREYYISYSGSLTFKNAERLRETVSYVPLDRLLVETDSPYLAPVPYRGKRNCSSYIYSTLCVLAELVGKAPAELALITSENAERVFNTVF